MVKYLKFCVILALFLLNGIQVYSTHLMAGEITSQRGSSGLDYTFHLTIYTDSHSVSNGVDEPTATLIFGDGTSQTVDRTAQIYVGNATYKNTYTFYHTYPGPSTYLISYQKENRNADVRNMTSSGNTPFYIESSVKISPFLGLNNSPVLLVPPVDLAAVGQRYIHNPGAYDPEGDSLSYELTIPKQNVGSNVLGYAHPNIKPVAGGSFSLNPLTGDLIWDAPLVAGDYNVAIIIKEWRNGELIGTIVRDMQIEVVETNNRRPILQIPNDICIVAGQNLNFSISASDSDGHKINLTSSSGVYTLSPSPAAFNVSNPQPSPAAGVFNWQTACAHIRDEPYQVIFKAEDLPASGPKLIDMKSWNIRVLGPKPTGFSVNNINKGFLLSWDPYLCSNASKMEIYRKDCDSADFIPGACESGVPASLGYTKIGEVSIGATSYSDTNNLNPGSLYCYMISAAFAAPKGGSSYASEEACGLIAGVPVLTNVTVTQTDSANGKVMIKWTQPADLDMAAYPEPYQYRLLRSEGASTAYVPVYTFFNLTDTAAIDSSINTRDSSFNYKLEFYYTGINGITLKSTSPAASTVFLTSSPGGNKINLSWTYNVPWNNSGQYHRIYKENSSGIFVLIDSVFVTGDSGSYTETGLTNGDTVCYFVETQGRYCLENIPSPIVNRSQIVCEAPRDTVPPCPPLLSGPADCIEDGITQLTVNWIPDYSAGCNKDIKGYNVYYAERENEEPELIASNVPGTFFIDTDIFSLAGCYAVTAMNFYGIESSKSNKVCVDLCVYYELPNLITPNKDHLNDVFRPFPVPKNVEQVKFSVFNRWGKMVHYSEDDINLNWTGVDSDGGHLPSGIYYFHAEVKFKRRLRKEDEIRNIKGWVHVIRKEDEPAVE